MNQQPNPNNPRSNAMTEVRPTPDTPTVTKLAAEMALLRLQVRSALLATQAGADTNVTLSNIVHNQAEMIEILMGRVEALSERVGALEPLDAIYRQELLHAAVLAVEQYVDEEQQPVWSDVWEVDQSKTDLNLTFRIEEHVL